MYFRGSKHSLRLQQKIRLEGMEVTLSVRITIANLKLNVQCLLSFEDCSVWGLSWVPLQTPHIVCLDKIAKFLKPGRLSCVSGCACREGPCSRAESDHISSRMHSIYKQESGPKHPQSVILPGLHFEYLKRNGENLETLERGGQGNQEENYHRGVSPLLSEFVKR